MLRAEIDVGPRPGRCACGRRRLQHPDAVGAGRLRPGLGERSGRPSTTRWPRGDTAALTRLPAGSPAGRPSACWPGSPATGRAAPASSTAARRTASGTSWASGSREHAADRGRRAHGNGQVGAGAGARRTARRGDRERRRHAALPRYGHRHRQAGSGASGAASRIINSTSSTSPRRPPSPTTSERPPPTSRRSLRAARCRSIVGGSMLYLQSLLDDWAFPATDPAVRARWEGRLAEVGVAELHAELARRDAAAAATILPTDGRRIVRALEVVELTGRPFAASAPTIGAAPRWDTLIVGLDWQTTILDERLARRTDAMFDGGLVDEVRALWTAGLRDGVTASRALGYAQVIEALDAGPRRGSARGKRPSSEPAAMCAGSVPGSAATTASAGWTARRARLRRSGRRHGGTYPDPVRFAKGHGTQNDFVVLLDMPVRDRTHPGPGRGTVRPAPRTGRRRSAAGDGGRCGARSRASSTICPKASRPTTGSWTTETPTARWPRCAATASGCSPTTCGPPGWSGATSSPSARWPAPDRW